MTRTRERAARAAPYTVVRSDNATECANADSAHRTDLHRAHRKLRLRVRRGVIICASVRLRGNGFMRI